MGSTRQAAADKLSHEGWVMESTGSWYRVLVNGKEIRATVRGKLRLDETNETNPVAVGDNVRIRELEEGTGVISEVLPRRNRLVRRAAGRRVGIEHVLVSNVDFIWAVSSVKMPRFNPGFWGQRPSPWSTAGARRGCRPRRDRRRRHPQPHSASRQPWAH